MVISGSITFSSSWYPEIKCVVYFLLLRVSAKNVCLKPFPLLEVQSQKCPRSRVTWRVLLVDPAVNFPRGQHVPPSIWPLFKISKSPYVFM